MIKIYDNGLDFYNENKEFLLTNEYSEVFFRLDSPLLVSTNKDEYAIKVYDDNHRLVALLKEPYNFLLFGDYELVDELVTFLIDNNYKIKDYLCPMELGDKLMECFNKHNYPFRLSIGMDFMEANTKVDISSDGIETPTLDDVDELYELTCLFIADCGLKDTPDKQFIINHIDEFRIIRKDGHIVSMAKSRESTKTNKNISYVFTRKDYRGQGLARKIVGTILNEIIDSGYLASLNVDKNNPISNHVYYSLGFRKIFSQGIYVLS